MNRILLIPLLALHAHAAPLVRLSVGSTQVTPEGRVTTGKKSYSELALDQGTVRVGSSTALSTQAGAVQLEKGLALVATKSKFFRPSVTVRTPRHQLAVRGTAQVFHGADGSLKVAVLEGRLTLALSSLSGESITLRAGQAVVVKAVDQALPKALNIDLDRLMSSAELVSGRQFDALPTRELMDGAVQRQTREAQSSDSRSHQDKDSSTSPADDAGTDERIEEISQEDVGEEVDDLDGDGQDDADDPDFEDTLDGEDDPDDEDTGGDDGEGDGDAPGDGDEGGGDDPGDGEG